MGAQWVHARPTNEALYCPEKQRGTQDSQTHCFIHTGSYSMNMIPEDLVDHNFRMFDDHNGPEESLVRPSSAWMIPE